MSRITKNIINNVMIKDSDDLDILIFPQKEGLETEIFRGSNHKYYTIISTPYKTDRVQTISASDLQHDLFLNINLILNFNPYIHLQNAVKIASQLHIPIVNIHQGLPAIKKEAMFKISIELDKYMNLVTKSMSSHLLINNYEYYSAENIGEIYLTLYKALKNV